ncbi:hypothetical protein E3N88_26581 [Mikania micrantha]|uniref:Armadillo repeat-containing domain-containing protein n=1 Tax=Mikania micrantha TaxID=192012 RepID=A0A5N6MVC0_9ASTR|nr:hypothetical protein E3N88_26581 [Mikania micrantha]
MSKNDLEKSWVTFDRWDVEDCNGLVIVEETAIPKKPTTDSYGYLEIHVSLHLSRFFRGRTKPTADPDNAWEISAYGGVPILLDVCRSGSLIAQSRAIGAIRNVASFEDIRVSIGEEAGVPVIVGLLASGSATAKEKAANCIAILASFSEYFRAIIIQEKGLQKLLQLLQVSSNADSLE